MNIQACLNGARSRAEHPRVPLTPAELAADALACRRAGAFAVHLHPRDAKGLQSIDAAACDAAVSAIRAAAPGLPIGLSTAEAIERDPFRRAAA
ncbi:MAG: 3-keto-5-aminohexanoate cleavage protein, partial [Solirubrobacteraceae bacterium]